MNLTEKQQALADRAVKMFGDKGIERQQAILNAAAQTYDIELADYTDEMVFDAFNDVVYDASNNLYDRYVMPPFSVLDTRRGEWLERRNKIDQFFGNSLIGRKEGLAYGAWQERSQTQTGKKDNIVGSVRKDDNGTSKFDSVLCELLLKWHGFKGARVLDPFAGGHIRGAMAAYLGYEYTGFDISAEQIAVNERRATEMGLNPRWINDDAQNLSKYITPESQDLVFTCPPYGDLEVYSSDPKDLSTMPYEAFEIAHTNVISQAVASLKPDRFAVWVVGDFRDEKGFYRGFVASTINAFAQNGVKLYNEAVLINSVGTASMRASGAFGGGRKLVKVHQNVLVFYKGDPKQIQSIYGRDVDNLKPFKPVVQNALF